MKRNLFIEMLALFSLGCVSGVFAGNYDNFRVAIYTRAYEVQKMCDQHWLDSTWNVISSQMKVDKIYLETHRDKLLINEKDMRRIKKYFEDRGVKVSGGITYTISEGNSFETYCYKDPTERKKAQEIIELTAGIFDEIVLDDFFFTDCKCKYCLDAKGDRSWTEYRLELMDDAALNVILGPAKKVNPKCEVVIKYPNWYDHFPALGFDLDFGPRHYDGIYTGTETRDAVNSDQHLQPYESYLIWRYFDNLNHNNRGGWVDTGGMRYIDRYSEQIWMTMFAKSPEMTLFDYRQMFNPLSSRYRAPWQDQGTSFNFDKMMEPVKIGENKTAVKPTTIARAAGFTLEELDKAVGFLGNPVGVKSYKPYQSRGEEFLQNYFGMIGIPMDIVPEYPEDEFVLLTEQAAADKDILKKIDKTLRGGHDVMITSGFLHAMQGKGIENMFELNWTDRKALASAIKVNGQIINLEKPILMQQVTYMTNDSWEMISGMDAGLGWPLLHRYLYGDNNLYLLVVPDNFADLYKLPVQALNNLRTLVSQKAVPVTFQGPANVCLYCYDNNTFIVESLADEPVTLNVMVKGELKSIKDQLDGTVIQASPSMGGMSFGRRGGQMPQSTSFSVSLKPHSYRVLRY